MSDIRQEVIDMLKTPQLSSLATITLDGKPWTRYVMIQSDHGMTIRSGVCLDSRKVDQIRKNPEVHLTFGINDPQQMDKPYVQVQGIAGIATDKLEKHNFWFDMLSAVFSGPDDPNYAVLKIEPYRIELNRPGKMVPEVWEK